MAAVLVFLQIAEIAKLNVFMKKQNSGTNYVPTFRASNADVNSHQKSLVDEFLPEDCTINTSSDAYYLGAIVLLCATFIFPPFILGVAYCVVKAKKGDSNE